MFVSGANRTYMLRVHSETGHKPRDLSIPNFVTETARSIALPHRRRALELPWSIVLLCRPGTGVNLLQLGLPRAPGKAQSGAVHVRFTPCGAGRGCSGVRLRFAATRYPASILPRPHPHVAFVEDLPLAQRGTGRLLPW